MPDRRFSWGSGPAAGPVQGGRGPRGWAAAALLLLALLWPAVPVAAKAPADATPIHLHSFQSVRNAENEASLLKKQGYRTAVRKVFLPGKGTWYRVYVGRMKQPRGQAAVPPDAPVPEAPAPAADPPPQAVLTRQKVDDAPAPSAPVPVGAPAAAAAALGPAGPADPLVAAARAEYDGGRYGRASEMLDDLLRQKNVDASVREQAARLKADSNFRLGGDDNRKLLAAVDAHKKLLEQYPDPSRGNDDVYFNLARSYEKLKFYYEAAAAMEKLVVRYPDSPHAVDVSFALAEMNRKTGKTELAAARLEEFLSRHPDHPNAKSAALGLMAMHLAGGRIDSAAQTARTVLGRWPDLSVLSPEALLNLGLVHYWSKQYSEAVRILSLAASLHPAGEHGTAMLYVLGCALFQADRPAAALAVFSRVRELKPDSWEGEESTLAAANIGLIRPDLKVPFFLALAPAFRDPLEAYGDLLRRSRNPGLIERVRFQRAYGCWVKGRYGEALREFQQVAAAYPQGAFAASSRDWMMAALEKVVDESVRKGDYAAVAALYFGIPARDLQARLDFRRLHAIGASLAAVGLSMEAKAFWLSLRSRAPDDRARDLLAVSVGRLELERGDTAAAARMLQDVRRTPDPALAREIAALRAGLDRLAGRRSDAVRSYEEALSLPAGEEGDPSLQRELAALLAAEGKVPEAIGRYRQAIRGFSADPERRASALADGRTRLAELCLKGESPEEGLRLLQDVSSSAPEASQRRWSSYRLGRTLEKQGNQAGAEKAFDRMKGTGEDEFWGKVGDFAREDARWSRKFKDILR